MRQGYTYFSDGKWRKIYHLGQQYMMVVRNEEAGSVRIIRGKSRITDALLEIRRLSNDDALKVTDVLQRLPGLAQQLAEDSDA
jgi:hypothetical protein